MPHEDPINGCRCHFLGQPALSWDPLSQRRAITPICFIALVWAELKKGAFFLPAGAPGRPDLGLQPGGSMGISGKKKYVCNGLAYGPATPNLHRLTGSSAPSLCLYFQPLALEPPSAEKQHS